MPLLVKLDRFQSSGRSCFVGEARLLFYKDSECWILGLSNEVYIFSVAVLIQEIFDKNRRTFVYRTGTFWGECTLANMVTVVEIAGVSAGISKYSMYLGHIQQYQP